MCPSGSAIASANPRSISAATTQRRHRTLADRTSTQTPAGTRSERRTFNGAMRSPTRSPLRTASFTVHARVRSSSPPLVETIALAYLALLVVGAITVGTARRPVLLRGATLLRLNGLFAVVSLLIALADPNQRPPAVTFVAFLGLVTLAVRGRWIVFLRGTPDVLPL